MVNLLIFSFAFAVFTRSMIFFYRHHHSALKHKLSSAAFLLHFFLMHSSRLRFFFEEKKKKMKKLKFKQTTKSIKRNLDKAPAFVSHPRGREAQKPREIIYLV